MIHIDILLLCEYIFPTYHSDTAKLFDLGFETYVLNLSSFALFSFEYLKDLFLSSVFFLLSSQKH